MLLRFYSVRKPLLVVLLLLRVVALSALLIIPTTFTTPFCVSHGRGKLRSLRPILVGTIISRKTNWQDFREDPLPTSFQSSRKSHILLQSSPRHDYSNSPKNDRVDSKPRTAEYEGEECVRQGGPFPSMPSQIFLSLVHSQFDLLANSFVGGKSKIRSMALYLPQENPYTGQLEFLPTVVYPSSERIFIASDAGSGLPPTIPKTLTKLPGFAHAQSLIPAYPFATARSTTAGSASAVGVGVVEECDTISEIRGSALSVPLFSGSRTMGVLLVWPSSGQNPVWTSEDKLQVARAANSLAMALSMDNDRAVIERQTEQYRVALADNLHQVKNPLQAMRTFAKLLQRKIALEVMGNNDDDPFEEGALPPSVYVTTKMSKRRGQATPPQLLALAENMMLQSDRVIDLLVPMDTLVDSMEQKNAPSSSEYLLNPARPPAERNELTLHTNPTTHSTLFSPDNAAEQSDLQTKAMRAKETSARATKTQKLFHSDTIRTDVQKMNTPLFADLEATVETSKESQVSRLAQPNLGDVKIEMSFLPDVLDPILTAYRAIAADRGILFEVNGIDDDLTGVKICPKSLQEAVANLLDNAMKYVVLLGKKTETQKKPRVRLTFLPNQDQPGVTILLEDNGPGIPAEERDSVFERGYRGEMTRSASIGSGIGLAISRAMISRMGGRLEIVENQRDHLDGTVMQIVLFRDPPHI